jgi:molybdate transport system substrate-binding protein
VKSRFLVVAVLTAVVAGCASPASSPIATTPIFVDPTVTPVELDILAAASLQDALERAFPAYQAFDPTVTLVISTDSSAALATRIEQGAPADVFLAADLTNPNRLVAGGFADDRPVVFAGNELAVIVPTDNPGGVASPMDLAKAGVDVIAAGDEVPITKYATQLVRNLAGLGGDPAGFEAAYAANVASKEENVKAVVAKVELGQGDAAIVYATDAKGSTKVRTIDVPAAANVTAAYGGLVLKASAHPEAARTFLAWWAGPDGRAILAGLGFLPPPA